MPPKRLVSLTGKPIILPAVRANAGLQMRYQRKLEEAIDAMARDTQRTVRAAWNAKPPPDMAEDQTATERAGGKSAAMNLRVTMAQLARKWTTRFDKMAEEMGEYFSRAAFERGTNQMKEILSRAGWTVPFQATPAVHNALQATIGEQVALIKSIPGEYMLDVQGSVMRSVTGGRDLATLTTELVQKHGIARRRAVIIARDQNNKATATITQARQVELGLQAMWMHSRAGKIPRPSHVAADGKQYDPAKGMLIEGEWIKPGEKINCRCFSKSIVPGFS